MFQMKHFCVNEKKPVARPEWWSWGLVLATTMFVGIGCGKERFPRNPNLVPVSGVVTIDGEPTQFVKVIFAEPASVEKAKAKRNYPVAGPFGVTDAKGAYSLTTNHANDGALPGDYIVVFEWTPPGVGADFFEDGIPKPGVLKRFPPKLVPIYEKYSAGKEGNMPYKVEAKKPVRDANFNLTTTK